MSWIKQATSRPAQALLLSVLTGGVIYFALMKWVGWDKAVSAFKQISVGIIVLALMLSLVNYLLRFLRWQYYLRVLGHNVPVFNSLHIYLAGFALTTTPAKAGEALRSVFLKKYNVSYSSSLACFFSERLSDLLAVILLCAIGIWAYPQGKFLTLISLAAIVTLIILVQNSNWLAHFRKDGQSTKLSRSRQLVNGLINIVISSQACLKQPVLLYGLLLSLAAWGAEALAFYFLLNQMGADISLLAATFIYSFALLVGAISFIPGGLIGTELTMIGLLMFQNITEPQAIAATVIIRITTLWFAVLIGIGALSSRTLADN